MKKKISFSVILVAALLVMSMAALALNQRNIFRQASEQERPIVPLEGADGLVATNLGSTGNADVTLTVEEGVYDGQGAMVLVRLTPRDVEHYALYNPYLQDAPDSEYEKALMPRRVGLGYLNADRADGTTIDILYQRDQWEMLVDGRQTEIPNDRETARAQGSPVYMDGKVMRATDEEEMEVTGRRDGRKMIDYNLTLTVTDGIGGNDADTLFVGSLSAPSAVEAQDDGSVLCWFNGYAETPMEDALALRIGGETLCGGRALALDEVGFALKTMEPEHRLRLVPEQAEIAGKARVTSATVNLSRVRGYLTIEWDSLSDDPYDYVSFRLLGPEGKPLNEGMGWMSSGDTGFSEQYECQSFDPIPEVLTLEVLDKNGDVVGQCACKVVEVKG